MKVTNEKEGVKMDIIIAFIVGAAAMAGAWIISDRNNNTRDDEQGIQFLKVLMELELHEKEAKGEP